MSSSSHSTSTRSSKCLSLNLTNGPRPLQLVHANSPSDPTTPSISISAQSSPSKSTPPSTNALRTNPRRQSSISYLPRDQSSDKDVTVRFPLTSPRHSSIRSQSVSGDSTLSNPPPTSRDRRSAAFDANGPPLTHAEKHSELLHFIAQKEATCLELRSLLAVHEAELLELKRRWERVISRGFEASTSDGASSQGQGSGAMLEGIREGVQGVSRFLAAGLAIGELSPPLTSVPPRPSLRRTHSANQSSSSISTNNTKSTRFSQSSVSSIGEEPLVINGPSSSKEYETVQVLIVRDTGATPTMSPNPDFVHEQQQREAQERAAAFVEPSPETEPDCCPSSSMRKSTKIPRRESRDNSDSFNLTLPLDHLLPLTDSPSSSRSVSPSADLKRESTRVKRATTHGPLPPMSSIPGLGSLTIGTTPPPVVSWVGSVGKKWDELQRGSTFSKSQKRASLLLSDMSQSIASAISISTPPLRSAASGSPDASASASASALSTPLSAPSYFSPLATSLISASTTSTSLLDDDEDDLISSSIMKPDLKLKLKPTPIMQPLGPSARPGMGTKLSGAQSKVLEEEWNW